MAPGDQRRTPARPVPFACIRGLGEPAALDGVVRLCATLTPRIERHPTAGAVVLDLGGSERLVLGEEVEADTAEADAVWPALAKCLTKRLWADVSDLSGGVRMGIGPTRTVAWLAATVAAAEQDRRRAILPDQVAGFLATLPLRVLTDVPDLVAMPELVPALEALALSGIGTLGQVRRLTPLALQRRFGPFGASIATIAAGHDLRPLRVERLDEWTGIRLRCEPALRTQQLPLALAPLAEQVTLTLQERQQMAGAIALLLYPEFGEPLLRVQELSHPLTSASALLDQARRLLEQLVPTDAAGATTYHGVHLRVGKLQAATAEQRQLWSTGTDRTAEDQQARRLAAIRAIARMGGKATLFRAFLQQPDAVLPEDQYHLEPLHCS